LHLSNYLKKSDWGHFANFKMATEEVPVLLASSDRMLLLEEFDRKYLVKYFSREIWLSETEAWLKTYTDGSLFEGRAGSGVFPEELDLKASFALAVFATVFQAEVYAILASFDYCLREFMTPSFESSNFRRKL
jgi:hypothetical protein